MPLWTRATRCCLHRSRPRSNKITATSGGSPDVVLCPDVAPRMDSRFDCRDLLQRSVIHYAAERKASSAIISAPIQGVTTGTVASVSRDPSEDRSSGLVSTQAGAFMLAASVGRLYRGRWREP